MADYAGQADTSCQIYGAKLRVGYAPRRLKAGRGADTLQEYFERE